MIRNNVRHPSSIVRGFAAAHCGKPMAFRPPSILKGGYASAQEFERALKRFQ